MPSSEVLRFPPVAPAPARPHIPLAAAVLPVVGAVVLWVVTRSPYALWFAALGPLMVVAAQLDARRARRRHRREGDRESALAVTRLSAEVTRRHGQERARLWARTSDAAGYVTAAAEMWRAVPGRDGTVVVGRGHAESMLVVEGGEGPGAQELRERARRLSDAPVTVELEGGLAILGPPMLARAALHAIVAQAIMSHPPEALRVSAGDDSAFARSPHARSLAPRRIVVGHITDVADGPGDILMVWGEQDAPPPPRCAAVLRVRSPTSVVLDSEGSLRDVQPEFLAEGQVAAVVDLLVARADAGRSHTHGGDLVAMLGGGWGGEGGGGGEGGLLVPIGSHAGAPVEIDLIGDGPHAVVIGQTGSGKSEVLTTWIAAMCARYRPDHVTFLLVDFKGGRTFDAFVSVPHVCGVLTDLGEVAAVRAIVSLRAEVRRREAELAHRSARDIEEAGQTLSRLVVVVDEYAALVASQPDLHEVFIDLAARGRALGIHLILASQRATGVFRDSLLANIPLRVALRVADASDSRLVLGTDAAAQLPGGRENAGSGYIRAAADDTARSVRFALCPPAVMERAGAAPGPIAVPPWLPELPAAVPLESVRRPGRVLVALADDPEQQRQPLVELADDAVGLTVVGQAGAGRSEVVKVLAQQAPTVWVGPDLEQAWDAARALPELPPGSIALIDDIDVLLARFPSEYATEMAGMLEHAIQEARARRVRVVITARRLIGATARLADLIPGRLVLALPSRADHIAAGGAAPHYRSVAVAGRGSWGGLVVQVLHSAAAPGIAHAWSEDTAAGADVRLWHPAPDDDAVALVVPHAQRAREIAKAWSLSGRSWMEVDAAEPSPRPGIVVWGTVESWTARWTHLVAARSEAMMVVDAGCAAEFRTLTGSRTLPPYAAPRAGRAWLWQGDGEVLRVRLASEGSAQDGRYRGGFDAVRGSDTAVDDVPIHDVHSRRERRIAARGVTPSERSDQSNVGERRVGER